MKHALKYVVFGLIVMAFLTGCGKQPTEEINDTKAAIDRVVAEGAEKYAPGDVKLLNDALAAAMDEVKVQDGKVFKNYGKAKEMLAKVKADTETLRTALPQKKEEAKALEAEEVKPKKPAKKEIKEMAETKAVTEATAVIETKFGNMEVRFFPDVAPNHVKNFLELAKKGFYDGTTFHRVIPGFMIQGGDPNSKNPDRARHGLGGPGYTLKAEFSNNAHKRSILSMARTADPDSAGSQFFICVADSPWLDGKYTVFGEVVAGMDAADKIVSLPRDKADNPLERVEIKIRVMEK